MAVDSEELFKSGGNISEINIREEMKRSFIDYAMSVIVSRALPDVRDGLKPVHRRILYAMHDMGMTPEKPYKKCARIVGEVLGKYHPHGDTAVYDSLVRMAQPFSSRYTLVDGHGNFGSLDDGPAAMRYTESKLHKISMQALADIEANTVDFQDNFDGSLKEPKVLPTRIPSLLLNGTTGIAVGMATNIPPHNLTEVMDGVISMIDDPEISFEKMNKIIKGPDFPSGSTIMGTRGIIDAYTKGKGSVTVKGTYVIDEVGSGRNKAMGIIITELPYLVGPEQFITKVADLVRNEKITGISDANDESGRQGMRIVIKVKRDARPEVVVNNLLKHTPLQQNFAINTVALVNGKPKQLGLLEILKEFIEHRVEVVTRRSQFELDKAERRDHILQGLLIALDDIDKIITLIKKAPDTETAREGLIKKFKLTEIQANAILEMQLRRLTGLEREKIEKEHKELVKKIKALKKLLSSRALILEVVKKESEEVKEKFGDERKTKISAAKGEEGSFSAEDLIANEDMVVFLTQQDYIKRIPLKTFERQRRATRGKGGIKTRDEDDLQDFFIASMHNTLLFFTNQGRVYSSKVYDLPEGSRQSKGQALVNLISLKSDETITAVIPVTEFADDLFLNMLTLKGVVKKIRLSEFENVRKTGIIAMGLDKEDSLAWVRMSDGTKTLVLGTACGMVIRYSEDELRPLGRTARGVKAMSLRDEDKLVGFDVVDTDDANLLLITSDGFGKRVKVGEFRVQGRGGLGLIGIKFKTAQSRLASVRVVKPEDEFIIASSNGVIVRQTAGQITQQSRMATGVRVQKLDDGDEVITVSPIVAPDEAIEKKLLTEEDPSLNQVAAAVAAEMPDDMDEPIEEFVDE